MKVYLVRLDLHDGDEPSFYAVPVVDRGEVFGERYSKDSLVSAFLRGNLPDYGMRDVNDGLRAYSLKGGRRDGIIETGDDLFIRERLIGTVERIIFVEGLDHTEDPLFANH